MPIDPRTSNVPGLTLVVLAVVAIMSIVTAGTAGAGVDPLHTSSSLTSEMRGASMSRAGTITCTAAAGRVAVAIVVVPGDGAVPVTRCVDLPTTANGIDALRGAGFTARIERGFVCGIDGIPATGCATGAGFDGSYWRYFRGGSDGRWNYASVGAGTRLERHDGCAQEGWVWSSEQKISPPQVPVADLGCAHTPAETRPPTTTTSKVPPTTRPGTSGSSSAAGGGAAGPGGPGASTGGATRGSGGASGAGGTTRPDNVSTERPSTEPGAGNNSPAESPADGGGAQQVDRSDPAADGVSGESGTEVSAGAPLADGAADDEGSRPEGRQGSGELAAVGAGPIDRATDGAGSPVGVLVALVLVAVIGAGAVVVGRRRVT